MSRKAWILLVPFMGLLGCDAVEDGSQGDGATATISGMEPRSWKSSGDDCKVVLRDSFNKFSTILRAKSTKKGSLSFLIDDKFGLGEVKAKFASRNSPLKSSVSVPDDTLNEIRKRYKHDTATFNNLGVVQIDDQLTYVILPEAACTKDEFALILFFVDEWFYFG